MSKRPEAAPAIGSWQSPDDGVMVLAPRGSVYAVAEDGAEQALFFAA